MAEHPPPPSAWIRSSFDPNKAAPGYSVSAHGRTARLVSGAPYHTVQGTEALHAASGSSSNRFYYEAVFSGLVGGIGFAHLNDKTRANIYNRDSFLLSGYGDLYCFGSSIKGVAPNIARSSGTRIGALLDMDEGTLTYWVDGQQMTHIVEHENLKSGEWYITVTFGSGAAGAQFVLAEPPPPPLSSRPLASPPPSPPPSPLGPEMVGVGVGVAADLRVAVVGASLGGLSVANVLHRAGSRVSVFELYPSGFHLRGGALGSVNVDLVAAITGDQSRSRVHPPIRGHGHFYGDLWQRFFAALPDGTVTFGTEVRGVLEPESDAPRLRLNGDATSEPFDLIIGADGGKSVLRSYVTASQPSYAGYQVWRGLVPCGLAPMGPPSGRAYVHGVAYETLGFACNGPPELGELCNTGIYVATPEAEVQPPTRNRQVVSGSAATAAGGGGGGVPVWFVPFVRALFGERNAQYWAACATHGKVSAHPVWELAADRVVHRRLALLGDAAHMASPRTGAGAYTAMVDAVVLGRAVAGASSLEEALSAYNADTVQRGRELYQASRRAAASFAPQGSGQAILSPSQIAAGER